MSCGLLLVFLIAAAVMDVRHRRVPNLLTGSLLVVGLLAAAWHVGALSLSGAVFGACVGLIIWLPFWLMGLLGAGDVKFFAAACAWIGPSLAWRGSLAVALLGGLMGGVILVRRRGARSAAEFGAFAVTNVAVLVRDASTVQVGPAARSFPYAVPMAVVVGLAACYPNLFH